MSSEINQKILPRDLATCEQLVNTSLLLVLKNTNNLRISVDILFEGIKIIPVIFRIIPMLIQDNYNICIAFSDFGSAALAKRDYSQYQNQICTFKDLNTKDILDINSIVIAVAPQPYDYDEFEYLCKNLNNRIIMFNGKLEETSIGIGLVGRERRSRFIKSWSNAYLIEPLENCALQHVYPYNWFLFKYHLDGYRYIRSFSSRPSIDSIEESLG